MEMNSCTGEAPQTAESSGMNRRWKIEFGCCANEILPKRSVVLWANFPFYCIFTEFGAKNAWRMAWGGARHGTIREFLSKEVLSISRTTTQPWPKIADPVTFSKHQMPGADENLIKFLCVLGTLLMFREKSRTLRKTVATCLKID